MDNDKLLKELKREAMSRKRKVIFDNDGGDVTKLCRGTTTQDLINTRTKPALDAGVDTYIYTTGRGLGVGLHESSVGSVQKTKEGHLSGNLVSEFSRNETDCLRITADYVRSRGKEFFWGMRMNDTHDAGYGGVFMSENRFKKDNPEIMFGKGVKYGAVTAVDYANENVRTFAAQYIMEVIDNYTVDGIFLDFFRHPIFFRSNANGRVAAAEELRAMTTFMREVKSELDKRRVANGVYYLTSVRVPDSVEYCRAIGLDIRTWLAEGLADVLFTTSYLHLNDWDYSVELAHEHGVPVYPSLDETRVRSVLPRHKRNALRGYHGRIMNAWDGGCDGVLMFNNSGLRDMKLNIEQNWFDKDAGTYQEGLAATVEGRGHVNTLSKTYFVSFRGLGAVASAALPHEGYMNLPTLNHHAPVSVGRGKTVDVPIRISDDTEAASKQGKMPTATANIFMFGDPDSLAVTFNGTELEATATENERADLDPNQTEYTLSADIPIRLIETGKNIFTFVAEKEATLLDLWVDLDYPDD